MKGYTPNYFTGVLGTHRLGTVHASYVTLRRLLGEPHKKHSTKEDVGDGDGKVSTEWIFRSASGAVVTLYDYKATSLYSSDLPKPEVFRRQRRVFDWSVGAHTKQDAEAFIAALVEP